MLKLLSIFQSDISQHLCIRYYRPCLYQIYTNDTASFWLSIQDHGMLSHYTRIYLLLNGPSFIFVSLAAVSVLESSTSTYAFSL